MGSIEGEAILALTGKLPSVRYPGGEIRDYTPGLELARERLDGDNARLRAARFDVRTLIPSSADEPDGPEFQALLASMREHGFLKQFWIAAQDDDVVVDGRARTKAAALLGLKVEYVKYGSDRERTAARRRDTPLNRVLIAVVRQPRPTEAGDRSSSARSGRCGDASSMGRDSRRPRAHCRVATFDAARILTSIRG